VTTPDPRYVRSPDGTYIAYLVVGAGPVDIAWQFDFFGNLDCAWDSPTDGAWYEALASFGRLILHDRRGTGLSTRTNPPNLETQAADLRLVLDHVGSTNTIIGGMIGALAPGVLLAATHPDRVRGLVWWHPTPRSFWAPDYPWGWGPAQIEEDLRMQELWGTAEYGQAWADLMAGELGDWPPEAEVRAIAKLSRNTCSPDVVLAYTKVWWDTDVRGVLPSVQAPTLLMVDSSDPTNLDTAHYVADLMPAAEVVVLPGDVWPTSETMGSYIRPRLETVQRFVERVPPARPRVDSTLASVLFTDIVGSTQTQAAMGDRAWKELVERHHALVRRALAQWRGAEQATAGDGFYATFDGPARAIRCALEVSAAVRDLGLEVRAGIHTGECEMIDGQLSGIAVSTGARISALAAGSQVLISQTVKDLVAGSGLTFTDAGEHELKGVPGQWHLYAVTG
jgi:class 3 adenylate cyclase/pimeloyl-ACP methyl ester carboxylesterase